MNRPVDPSPGELLRQQDLAGYRGIYDSLSGKLDPITLLLRDTFQVPIAGISIVDHDQVLLKSRVGIEADCIDRTGAFCAYAVESSLPFFAVPDATKDPRFSDNSLVTQEPRVRTYAAAPLRSPKGYHIGTVWVMDTVARTYTERDTLLLQALSKQAMGVLDMGYSDSITRLPNRRGFIDRLHALVATWQREGVRGTLVAFEVQETMLARAAQGWDASEQLLAEVGARLQAVAQGQDEFCCHIGSGAFAMVVRESANDIELLRRFDSLTAEPYTVGHQLLALKLHLGALPFPNGSESPAALVDSALTAAHDARQDDVQLAFFEPDRMAQRQRSVMLLSEVRKALQEREFVPYFQPQVDFADGRIVGFEVLARWVRPGGAQQVAYPEEFLPAVDAAQLMPELDLQVIEATCACLKDWRASGAPAVRAVCNLSRASLSAPGFLAQIDDCLARHGLPAAMLGLEVTESEVTRRPEQAMQFIDQLRTRGIHIALDDFGTGFSNLLALLEMRVDCIKVDRQLVQGISHDVRLLSLFKVVQEVARNVGCALVAEGVEDPRDIAKLAELGATCVQGWYFSRALPAQSAVHLLRNLVPSAGGPASSGLEPSLTSLDARASALAMQIGKLTGNLPVQ